MPTPNPERLLRRPKKSQQQRPPTTAVVSVVGGLIAVCGVTGAVIVYHGKNATVAASPVATPLALAAARVSYADNVVPRPAKHSVTPSKGAGTLPQPQASPSAAQTPAATPTPEPTPTPVDTRGKTNAEIAKARHDASARLAEIRHREAVQKATAARAAQVRAPQVTALADAAPHTRSTAPPVAPSTQSPATPDAQPTPVYAPRVVVDARFIDKVEPVYPDVAREQGAQGTAIVLATVGPRGNVMSVEVVQSTGNKLLDQAALGAARASRFEPPEIDGKPATETYRIVYNFDLSQ